MSALHQLLPVLAPGDAVSGHARQIQRCLRDAGLESDIFVEDAHPSLRDQARLHTEFDRSRHGDRVLYHFAVGSVLADRLRTERLDVVVDYHNLTPVEFFRRWDPLHTWAVEWGRRQLHELVEVTSLGLADSRFNEHDLVDAGYRPTEVVPILLDTSSFEHAVDDALVARLRHEGSGARWLFVGRVAPNKCQHDVISAFAVYRRVFDPGARLDLAGGFAAPAYREAIESFIAAAGLADAVRLWGPVSDTTLGALYAAADVFVCMSEHEGFCVPVLEAMHHGLPVVAHAAAAVPETVGDAALLVGSKSAATVATAVDRVVRDRPWREEMVRRGHRRVAHFNLEAGRSRLLGALGLGRSDAA